jgi:TrmH family RNA methyltransferase
MHSIKLVVVEPVYQINLGYIARTAMNFGIKRLYIVKPRCNHTGSAAIKYAKHARRLLLNAKICGSIGEATAGTFRIGTTGIWRKSGKAFNNIYSVDRICKMAEKESRSRGVSLILGRDDTGLSKDELAMCDATAFIQTDKNYPVLNISHALAILLYSFTKNEDRYDFDSEVYADAKEIGHICKLFRMSIRNRKDIRDKKAVAMAFSHITSRSCPTKKELRAISAYLSPRHSSTSGKAPTT